MKRKIIFFCEMIEDSDLGLVNFLWFVNIEVLFEEDIDKFERYKL